MNHLDDTKDKSSPSSGLPSNHILHRGGSPMHNASGTISQYQYQRRAWSRHRYAPITYITLVLLWVACAALWIIRYIPVINHAPLPRQVQFVGPPVAAALALVYGNWLRTVLSRIALGTLETNTGQARLWLDPMLGNGVWATQFTSFKSVSILLIISSTSLYSLGVNYALTVQDNVLSLSAQYLTRPPFPKGACASASNVDCPAKRALATTYSIHPGRSALYTVDDSITFFSRSAGASAEDISSSIPFYGSNPRGTLCANVPIQYTWQVYKCRALTCSLSRDGVQVSQACTTSIQLNTSAPDSMGWAKCSNSTGLPTYVIAATNTYARNLALALGRTLPIGSQLSSFAVQCDPAPLESSGRTVTYTSSISDGYDKVVTVESDGTACSLPELYDYTELADVALDLVFDQNAGTDGWMDALMTAASGYLTYANFTSLGNVYPLDKALSNAMNGVLSQVNYLTQTTPNDLRIRKVTYTPAQSSFQQVPLGQALVTIVMALATIVFLYGRRYMPDKEWQRGNLTLRLLAIEAKSVTGMSLANADGSGLHVLDDSRLAEQYGTICLTRQGNRLEEGAFY